MQQIQRKNIHFNLKNLRTRFNPQFEVFFEYFFIFIVFVRSILKPKFHLSFQLHCHLGGIADKIDL